MVIELPWLCPRLKPEAPTTGHVDGAWWIAGAVTELPALLAVLPVRLGPFRAPLPRHAHLLWTVQRQGDIADPRGRWSDGVGNPIRRGAIVS
jgi:hypothetical protein